MEWAALGRELDAAGLVALSNCTSDPCTLGQPGHPYQGSSYPLVKPGIYYKPVSRERLPTIGILRCRWLPCPPFPKERARDRAVWAAMHTKQA
jgi:hypothetical protein